MIEARDIYVVLIDNRSPHDASNDLGEWSICKYCDDYYMAATALMKTRGEVADSHSTRKETPEERVKLAVYSLKEIKEV